VEKPQATHSTHAHSLRPLPLFAMMDSKPSPPPPPDAPPRRQKPKRKAREVAAALSPSPPPKRHAPELNPSDQPALLPPPPRKRAAPKPRRKPARKKSPRRSVVPQRKMEASPPPPSSSLPPPPPRPSLEQEVEAVLSRGAGVHVVPTFAGKPRLCTVLNEWVISLSPIQQCGHFHLVDKSWDFLVRTWVLTFLILVVSTCDLTTTNNIPLPLSI
jgi:hypothetical protein